MTANPKGLFITGTDTRVGKTVVATAVVRALARRELRVAVMKPVAAGATRTPEGLRNPDAVALLAAANVTAPYEVVNPYCFAEPVSPHIAARGAEIAIDTEVIKKRFDELARNADAVIVEGAGGWLAPIGSQRTMADVAVALGLPVLLVVGLRLGCLNHTLLTAQAITSSGARLVAWIGNHLESHLERSAENIATLEARLSRAPLDILRFEPNKPDNIDLSASAAALLRACLDR